MGLVKRWGLYYGRGLYYYGRVRNAYFWPRGRARLQKMAGKETQDSLLLLESKEEGELSEALKRNLLLEVFISIPIYGVIYLFFFI